jgi:7-keto-8-aminopelargonate synthetase-like enzyme
MVMIDECHATGFIGATGKGTLEAKGVMGRVDIITGTLGKAWEEQWVDILPKKKLLNCYVNVLDRICFQFFSACNCGASIKVLNY